MVWTCEICYDVFERKQNYKRHLESKRHIKRVQSKNEMLTCNLCKKTFSCKRSLLNHKNNYCEKMSLSSNKSSRESSLTAAEIEEMKSQIKDLQSMVEKIPQITTQNTTQNASNIQNNTNSHNNVTININPFGQENVDMISPEYFLHCLNRIYNSSPALAEKIYSYPENQNIRIPNKNKPYVSVQLENGKSKLQLLEKVLDEIENFCYTLLEEKFTDPEYRQQMSEMKQRAFENYMDAYENDDKGTVKKNIRNALKLLLLNMTEEAKT